MKPIFTTSAIIAIIVMGVINFIQHNTIMRLKDDTALRDIMRERDSLKLAITNSEARVEVLDGKFKKDSIKVTELDAKAVRTHTKIRQYEIKIKEMEKVVIHDVDSFFIHRYPEPGARGDHYFDTLESSVDRSRLTHEGLLRFTNAGAGFTDSHAGGDLEVQDQSDRHAEVHVAGEGYPDRLVSGFECELHQGDTPMDGQVKAL